MQSVDNPQPIMPELDTLHARIAGNLGRLGEQPFLTLVHEGREDRHLTYRELWCAQQGWVARYQAAKIPPRSTIILVLPHSEALYAALGGALLGAYIPAVFNIPSPKLTEDIYLKNISTLIAQSNATLIVTYTGFAEKLRNHLYAHNIQIPVINNVPVPGEPTGADLQRVTPDDIAFLQYSSGTTGLKKGVAVSHRALLWQVDGYARAVDLQRDDVIASWLPLYHDMGLVACWFLSWLTGVRLIAMSPFEWVRRPVLLLEKISAYRATLCWQPNFAYNHLAAYIDRNGCAGWDLSPMRMFINCSEPVSAASHVKFLHALAPTGVSASKLATCYAMAENTFAITASRPGVQVTVERVDAHEFTTEQRAKPISEVSSYKEFVSSGSPLPGVEIMIIDAAGGDLGERRVGELVVYSPSLFQAYFNNAEETARAIHGKFFHTGDLAYRANGEYFIVGRKKDVIIVAGKNIHPHDIEHEINNISGVIPGRGVAFGIVDEISGTEKIVIIVETHATAVDECAVLQRSVYNCVHAHTEVVPADVQVVAHQWLIKSSSGKISRALTREKYVSLRENIVESDAPPILQSACIRDIGTRVRETLKKTLSGPAFSMVQHDDSPLLTGGLLDSLSFAGLLAALEREFKLHFPTDITRDIDQFDSIFKLTALITKISAMPLSNDAPPTDWYAHVAQQFIAGEDRRKYQIAPQLADADRLPAQPDPVLGMISAANYRSKTLNTDARGFRCTIRNAQALTLEEFGRCATRRGVVLGNSVAYGIGVSGDQYTLASQLNAHTPDICWYNLAIRRSTLAQEVEALRRNSQRPMDYVIWFSGVNNLNFFLAGLASHLLTRTTGKISLDEADWASKYVRFKQGVQAELTSLARILPGNGVSVMFCLQPLWTWARKPLTWQESALFSIFDASVDKPLRRPLGALIGPLYQDYAQCVAAACRQAGYRLLDFNRHPEFNIRGMWTYIDRLHLTDFAHAQVAAILEKHYIKNRL
ncbi:MAG: AMP-binding protein [Pseudomonadota bacterium]